MEPLSTFLVALPSTMAPTFLNWVMMRYLLLFLYLSDMISFQESILRTHLPCSKAAYVYSSRPSFNSVAQSLYFLVMMYFIAQMVVKLLWHFIVLFCKWVHRSNWLGSYLISSTHSLSIHIVSRLSSSIAEFMSLICLSMHVDPTR